MILHDFDQKLLIVAIFLLVLFSVSAALEICPVSKMPTEISIDHVRHPANPAIGVETNTIDVTIHLNWANRGTGERGPIPNRELLVKITLFDKTVMERPINTSDNGIVNITVPTGSVDPRKVSYSIYASFAPGTKEPFMGSAKTVTYTPTMVPLVSFEMCLPFVLILGILMAAMYATGKNPFGYLDFSRVAFRPPAMRRKAPKTIATTPLWQGLLATPTQMLRGIAQTSVKAGLTMGIKKIGGEILKASAAAKEEAVAKGTIREKGQLVKLTEPQKTALSKEAAKERAAAKAILGEKEHPGGEKKVMEVGIGKDFENLVANMKGIILGRVMAPEQREGGKVVVPEKREGPAVSIGLGSTRLWSISAHYAPGYAAATDMTGYEAELAKAAKKFKDATGEAKKAAGKELLNLLEGGADRFHGILGEAGKVLSKPLGGAANYYSVLGKKTTKIIGEGLVSTLANENGKLKQQAEGIRKGMAEDVRGIAKTKGLDQTLAKNLGELADKVEKGRAWAGDAQKQLLSAAKDAENKGDNELAGKYKALAERAGDLKQTDSNLGDIEHKIKDIDEVKDFVNRGPDKIERVRDGLDRVSDLVRNETLPKDLQTIVNNGEKALTAAEGNEKKGKELEAAAKDVQKIIEYNQSLDKIGVDKENIKNQEKLIGEAHNDADKKEHQEYLDNVLTPELDKDTKKSNDLRGEATDAEIAISGFTTKTYGSVQKEIFSTIEDLSRDQKKELEAYNTTEDKTAKEEAFQRYARDEALKELQGDDAKKIFGKGWEPINNFQTAKPGELKVDELIGKLKDNPNLCAATLETKEKLMQEDSARGKEEMEGLQGGSKLSTMEEAVKSGKDDLAKLEVDSHEYAVTKGAIELIEKSIQRINEIKAENEKAGKDIPRLEEERENLERINEDAIKKKYGVLKEFSWRA